MGLMRRFYPASRGREPRSLVVVVSGALDWCHGEGKYGPFRNGPPLFFPYARRDLVQQMLCQSAH
jgi:hypothetical protein